MRTLSSTIAGMIILAATFCCLAEDESKVTMPLSQWEGMLGEMERSRDPRRPDFPVTRLERNIEGTFSKGLFKGVLNERIRVLDADGHVRVQVLDGEVSLGQVLLNGKRTSLIREGSMYTLGIDEPGDYSIRLEFYAGEDQGRFARRLRFRLPEGGITHVKVQVPEPDIDPVLMGGAITDVTQNGKSTSISGALDATGAFNLSWTRKVTHRGDTEAVLEAGCNTLFSVGESVVTGKTRVSYQVLEGETDMLELSLPKDIEIIDVEGESVLQWRTDSREGGRLTVLLRYLVSEATEMTVHFQLPADTLDSIHLMMPAPIGVSNLNGAAGIQAPPGLKIQVEEVKDAQNLSPVDMPEALTELSSSPLLYGFSYTASPRIELKISRHEQVTLTTTLIEELQASTVISEDGTEITKLKMRIRNNTREYLALTLPEGTLLTHSLVDGQPFRPALESPDDPRNLLIPLRQSERLEEGQMRTHTVRPGETLSDIANFYYSDPGKWETILRSNPSTLYSAHSVTKGQVLSIPNPKGSDTAESSFIVELAYKAKSDELGSLGKVKIDLPTVDVDTMKVTWHVYFPGALEPLRFDANLTQYSSIRYDPFRRIRQFIDRAMWVSYAWAGAKYKNILSTRKTIYRNETDNQKAGRGIKAAFPLVGTQYRFKRILLGRETPSMSITYIDGVWTDTARWIALAMALILTVWLVSRPRDIKRWIVAAIALAALLLAAHYVLGTHRRILWGIDLGLLLSVLRMRAGPLWQKIKDLAKHPWELLEVITVKNFLFLLGLVAALSVALSFPLLISSIFAVLLFFIWKRSSSKGKEAADA